MQPATDYCIVTARELDELEARVREYIEAGWAPLGGMQIERPHGAMRMHQYHQTMVRYESAADELESPYGSGASDSGPVQSLSWSDTDLLAS